MRIEKTDARARKWEHLKEATGERATSKALDVAADYYLKMHGDTAAIPTGQIEELMNLAEERGSITPAEIAEVLDVDELPVKFETTRKIGTE